jgi:peptidoglycan/LPS O-acetylase OafA/YrhL
MLSDAAFEVDRRVAPDGQELAAPRSAKASAMDRADYNVAVGYLRAFARFLVFALHASMAYYKDRLPLTRADLQFSAPVIDHAKFAGSRILIGFNEITLMSLMFFLSGLFLWPSLTKKGAGHFLRDRVGRLALPFLASGVLVAALAYYPAYLQATGPGASVGGYVRTWLTMNHWLTGPAWFLLLLFIYDLVAAALYVVWPDWGERVARLAKDAAERPLRFCLIVIAVSGAVYMPLALGFGAYDWWHVGFLWVQKSRALSYAAYFFLGAGAGAYGLRRGLVAPDGMLARNWRWWGVAGLVAFAIGGNLILYTVNKRLEATLLWGGLADLVWVICCAILAFALMAVFVRFARRNPVLDSFASNSYGMYLCHYVFVTWTQYLLLASAMPAVLKALCTLVVAVSLSWLLVAQLRRIPIVARTI